MKNQRSNSISYGIKEESTTFECPAKCDEANTCRTNGQEVGDMTKTFEEENQIASHSNSKATSAEIEGSCEDRND